MTKEKGGVKSSAATMLTAVRDMEKFPSVADDSGTYERQAKFLASRTVNAFTGATEWPHQLMAYALAGYRSYVSSGKFWYVFPHQLVSYIETDTGDDEMTSSAQFQSDDCDHGDNIVTSEIENGEESIACGVQVQLETLINESSCGNDSDFVRSTRKAGARMFKLDKKIFFVTSAESYRHRGSFFEAYSPLELEMIVDILPRAKPAGSTPEVRRGRQRRTGFDLAPEHSLSPHFQGFIRAKFKTPMLGGAPIPSLKKRGEPSEALSKYLLLGVWKPVDQNENLLLNR
ncbi:hypothetical protein DVH05_023376 [Phytophthora capsici]|nr:hypothetical protein DVH05_023376 [Phytophthora capsici]